MYERFPVLGERRKLQAGTLSGGEQQMLAIARALMRRPAAAAAGRAVAWAWRRRSCDEVFAVIEEIRASRHHRPAGGAERPAGAGGRGLRLRAGDRARSPTPAAASDLLADEKVIEAYLGLE